VVIDSGTETGAQVAARLSDDQVAWLVTVAPDGTPLPTPIWFWWDGATVLVYSQPGTPKLRHIAANPRVAVALRTDERADQVAVITGDAAVDTTIPAADAHDGFVAKYRAAIERLGYDAAGFAASYSVPIRITPTRLRAW
jgi:PPOX class probable F420-dependent enzyme